jgi:hypothetical protein
MVDVFRIRRHNFVNLSLQWHSVSALQGKLFVPALLQQVFRSKLNFETNVTAVTDDEFENKIRMKNESCNLSSL